ncbi:MAG: Eco57I restriction-modification methylase domain-containing protein [Cytophagaceae bacterium]|nr:Eco57I restriction-modification methylase domain-containing protein [Cytophagaceae bacterium]
MFDIREGFDIVIGNPPYVLVQSLSIDDDLKKAYNSYTVAQYKTDLYHLFIQKSIDLSASNSGILSFITPNTFLKKQTRF